MMDTRWKLYQGALLWDGNPVTDTPTQEEAKEAVRESGAMFARWTSDWDCGTPTEWWWCIKDTPFDIQKISSNYRYKINKGIKHFDVQIIQSAYYAEELYQVMVASFMAYPKLYRPHLDHDSTIKDILTWSDHFHVFAAFERESYTLCGYSLITEKEHCAELSTQKTMPAYEKLQLNAALVYAFIAHYNDRLSPEYYLVDGERNIKHQTHFFEYLIKYFEFRNAYCQLHIEYSPKMRIAVNLLYPLRGGGRLLGKFNSFAYNVYCVLKMEQIHRSFK